MAAAVKAELRKFFTTRMWWGMAIGVFLAGGLLAVFFALVVAGAAGQGPNGQGGAPAPGLGDTKMVSTVYTGGLSTAYIYGAVTSRHHKHRTGRDDCVYGDLICRRTGAAAS